MVACAQEFVIHQGDTGPMLKPRPSVLDDGVVLDADWHCYIAALDATGAVAIASREVTDKDTGNLRWLASFTPAETATLDVEDSDNYRSYKMVLEVVNTTTTPPFNVESHFVLNVAPQGIA